jgi:hypothetical protein
MSFKEICVGDYALRFYPSDNGWMCGITPEMMEALEQAEKQESLQVEPVAWMVYTQDGQSAYVTDIPNIQKNQRALPLYTAPPQRQPLTEEEIDAIGSKWVGYPSYDDEFRWFAREIERKHGIGVDQ